MEGRAAAWTLLGIVVCFKAGTGIVILLQSRLAGQAYDLLIATNLPLAIPAVLLIAGPVAFWLRLFRVRAKREQLRRSEWEVGASRLGPVAQPGNELLPPGHPWNVLW